MATATGGPEVERSEVALPPRESAGRGAATPRAGAGDRKPRLLYVSTFFPYPATGGGKLRVSNLLRRLAATYEIHYLCLGLSDEECSPAALAQAEPFCRSITVIPHAMRRSRAALKVFLTLRPYEINLFDSPELAAALRRLIAAVRPDVLWFSRLAAARYYLGDGDSALAVLDQHDLSSQLWHLMRAGAPQAWVRLFARVNGWLVERYERRLYRRFNVAVSVSEAERLLTRERIVRNGDGPTLLTAPNGVDLDFFTPAAPAPAGATRDLVLTGTMSHRRNIDAALYFANEIFPALAAEFERLRFVVVGKEPAREVLELGRRPGIAVTGPVADVRPWIARAEVIVAPYRFGSGVKHKLPIGMAMRKAIVSSSNGVQGLDIVHGRHALIADTAADFAAQVATLLRNQELREELGTRARQLAVEKYGWDGIVAGLVAEVEALRQRQRAGAATAP
jgi:sugar transferase (PEP-CTERM/EpsH1 system associated)